MIRISIISLFLLEKKKKIDKNCNRKSNLSSNTLHSPAPYVRHVCCLLCNIAKSRVRARVTVGIFQWKCKHCEETLQVKVDPVKMRHKQLRTAYLTLYIYIAYFTHFYLCPKMPLHNSHDFLKFRSLGKIAAGCLAMLTFYE